MSDFCFGDRGGPKSPKIRKCSFLVKKSVFSCGRPSRNYIWMSKIEKYSNLTYLSPIFLKKWPFPFFLFLPFLGPIGPQTGQIMIFLIFWHLDLSPRWPPTRKNTLFLLKNCTFWFLGFLAPLDPQSWIQTFYSWFQLSTQ